MKFGFFIPPGKNYHAGIFVIIVLGHVLGVFLVIFLEVSRPEISKDAEDRVE